MPTYSNRRMYAAEVETNHVGVLDREIKNIARRLNALEDAWHQHVPYEVDDGAISSDLSASVRKVDFQLRAAIRARAHD